MSILFQTPGFKPSTRLVKLITKKLNVLEQKHEHIIECRVYLKKEHPDNDKNRICELRVAVPGNDLFASKQAETFELAFSEAIQAIKRQIENRKPENQVSTPL